MAVHEFSSFYNEKLVSGLKVEENSKWIDFFHFTESNRDFRFNQKEYLFEHPSPKVIHYRMNGDKEFHRSHLRLSKSKKFVQRVPVSPWENDKRQRNFAVGNFTPNKNDFIILSDIDEIIDSRYAEELLAATKLSGIITIKLHYTLYFFNLFSKNWVGPPDYSYRVFLMTGDYFNSMNISSDDLRKAGERGDLINDIQCFPEFAGFHHSWLGNDIEALKKLRAYPHASYEHDSTLYSASGEIRPEMLADFIQSGKSVYGDSHKLEVNNEIAQLSAVERRRNLDLMNHFLSD
jgi:hypothetical protein